MKRKQGRIDLQPCQNLSPTTVNVIKNKIKINGTSLVILYHTKYEDTRNFGIFSLHKGKLNKKKKKYQRARRCFFPAPQSKMKIQRIFQVSFTIKNFQGMKILRISRKYFYIERKHASYESIPFHFDVSFNCYCNNWRIMLANLIKFNFHPFETLLPRFSPS